MQYCVICTFLIEEGQETVLTARGCKTINNVSLQSGGNVIANPTDKVHEKCRKEYVSKNHIKSRDNAVREKPIEYKNGFLDIVNLIRTKSKRQYSIKELIDEMDKISDGNGYSFNQMKPNLTKYFGNEILISTFQNKKTLVTLLTTCYEILNETYESSMNEPDSYRIVEKSAVIITSEVKSIKPNKSCYPSSNDLSLSDAQKFLPKHLFLFLGNIITGHNSPLKIVSIGQAIIQANHRENVMCPLQLALAVQMHYFTGSK